jgi:threonine/homoserine/homoserine lactone efflux protein
LILLLIFGLIGFFAGNISQLLTQKPGVQKWLDRMAGITCFALALLLLYGLFSLTEKFNLYTSFSKRI